MSYFDLLFSASSPRKKGLPPKLPAHSSPSIEIHLTEVERSASGARVNFTAALESTMPVKFVAGPKFTGELSKAVFIDDEGFYMDDNSAYCAS